MKASVERSAASSSAPGEPVISAWPGIARLRRAMNNHPTVVDVLLVCALAVGPTFAMLLALRYGHSDTSDVVDLLNFAAPWPLIWRRRQPIAVFATSWLICAAGLMISQSAAVTEFTLLIALYTVAAYRPRRPAAWSFGATELGIVLMLLRWQNHFGKPPEHIAVFLTFSCFAVTATVLGVNVGTRRQYLASLRDRAARAERERDQQAQIAAGQERARIAREMHDIVAHNLSVMIALADGAAFAIRAGSPEAEHAARKVSDTGRQALGEMRRLLGVLRDDQAEGTIGLRAPQPGIASIDDVVAQVRAAGLDARLSVIGKPFVMASTAQLAVFRLVQESLTNVLKHARDAREVRVAIRYDEPIVTVEVVDDGQGSAPAPAGGGGHGLTGMRERVAMFDGQVHAGPLAGGGWRVSARFDTARGRHEDAGDADDSTSVAKDSELACSGPTRQDAHAEAEPGAGGGQRGAGTRTA